MAKKRKRRFAGGLALPWERQNGFRHIIRRARWRVIGIVALILAGVFLLWRSIDHRSRYVESQNAIAQVHRAVRLFRTDIGRCPRSSVELLHPPRSRSRYLRRMPKDGWGRTLRVRCPGHDDQHGADVISPGPSGSFSEDDNIW